jgi:hypothetical protein
MARVKTMMDAFDDLDKIKSSKDRVSFLQSIGSPALHQVLKYMFDPNIKFLLPEGNPPYKVSEFDQPGRFLAEIRRMYLFVQGGNPNLSTMRREIIFIQMLENVDERDAELILYIKDKKSPVKGLTKKVVEEAFPGLLSK